MRNISFSMTTEAVRNRTKTVTRRLSWGGLIPGTLLQAVEKCQGLKKGEHVKPLAIIRVVSSEWEQLSELYEYDPLAAADELEREGFPGMTPGEFISMFCKANRCTDEYLVNRIEFEYVEEP